MELRKAGQSFVHLAIMEMFQAARRVTISDDMRRAIPLGSPTGMACSGWVRFLAELRAMQKPAGLRSAGFVLSRGLGRVSAIRSCVAI
jgi:hypothetical protein